MICCSRNCRTATDRVQNHNNELQAYTSRSDNVYVSDGALHLRPARESWQGKRYTSGKVTTQGRAAWRYGRFVVRARLPTGDGWGPAYHLLMRSRTQLPFLSFLSLLSFLGHRA